MIRKIKRTTVAGFLLVACAYYIVVLYILHFSLSDVVLPHSHKGAGELAPPYLTVSQKGNELLIRRFGHSSDRCVIFFPGQHGGIARYQKDLFPPIVRDGISVFAVSYPGQDGARGRGRLSQLPALIDAGLTKLDSVCHIKDAVFVGRSLGSMVAVFRAERWHPRGLVLDGVSPSLSDAIHTYMESHWYLRPATILPVRKILRRDYVLRSALDKLASTRIIIFQGSFDARTPASLARQAVAGRANVNFIEVAGARHSNVYEKVLPRYVASIVTLLNGSAHRPVKGA